MPDTEVYRKRLNYFRRALEYLNKMSFILVENMDVTEVLDQVMDIVIDALNADAGSLLLIDKINPDELIFTVTKGIKADHLKGYRLPINVGIAGNVAKNGKPLIVQSPKADKRYCEYIEREIDYKAANILCVPVYLAESMYGVIEVVNRMGEATYSAEDIELLQTISNFAACVVENFRLRDEIIQESRKLQTLMDNTKDLTKETKLEELILKIIKRASELMNGEAASVILKEKKELVFYIVTGSAGEKLKNVRISINEGIAGYVARTGESLVVSDVRKDQRFTGKIDKISGFQTKSVICAPMIFEDKILGVIEVINNKKHLERKFQEVDLKYFETFAEQCAIALVKYVS
ncbi:MAG: GAF domain-containing protein [Candidatus Hydrogenedentota bacterium]